MSEDERLRRAEIIAERRQQRISGSRLNSNERKKLSWGSKFSIQILASICIFGAVYFMTDNYSLAKEKIKPALCDDVNFEQLYWNIKDVIKNMNKSTDNTNDEEVNKEDNMVVEDKTVKEEAKKDEQTNGIGGGDEIPKESQTMDDVTFIKTHASFVKPVEGVITSTYGQREPTEIISANHAGIDIGVPTGTPIVSAMEGDVEFVSSEGGYGNHLKIINGEVSTLYAHCSNIVVTEGTHVLQGQKIAEAGETGNATGPHLHFEIRRNDVTVNPQQIFEL